MGATTATGPGPVSLKAAVKQVAAEVALRPCPHCGSEARFFVGSLPEDKTRPTLSITCQNEKCFCNMVAPATERSKLSLDQLKLVMAGCWNMRIKAD